jgi:RNA polymerase sigma-70 factor (ECF subfamily)
MAEGEAQLVASAQRGDATAFGVLYDRHADALYRFVFWKVRHRETAEDLTAKAFTKALEHIGSLTAADEAFRPWVFTIARNAVIDHFRTAKQHEDIADRGDIAGPDDVVRDAEARMRLAKVEQYLAVLDDTQREIVMLRVWSDLPYAEIAVITGKSADNCKMIFSRAVRKMRVDLAALLAVLLVRSIT